MRSDDAAAAADLVATTAPATPAVLDTGQLLAWLASEPPPDEVAATRDEALRRADYLAGRDREGRAALLRAARLVEWEMAHRWPAKGKGGPRHDDRPVITSRARDVNDKQAWQRVYGVGKQDRDWILSLTDPDRLSQAAIIAGPRNGAPPINHESAIEWYTPPQYIEAARLVMGSIDTDPASSAVAQLTVQATNYLTADDDGLAQPWHGNVWLNPPYKASLIVSFIDRLVSHHGQWICLTNNGTDTAWGQKLLSAAHAVCFTDHRIRFHNAEGVAQGPAMQGQMLTYSGPRVEEFLQVFDQFGVILL
jgi:ParB family chromosome partitioning protein